MQTGAEGLMKQGNVLSEGGMLAQPTGDASDNPLLAFIFILKPLDFQDPLPIELIPNHHLRRANAVEQVHIKNFIDWFSRLSFSAQIIYESDVEVVNTAPGHVTYNRLPLELTSKWRYSVISTSDFTEDTNRLVLCGNLLNPPLLGGFMCIPTTNGTYAYSHNSGKTFNYYEAHLRMTEAVPTVPSKEIHLLRECTANASKLPFESFIVRALYSYDEARLLPENSDAAVLTYFGIIESLITHVPEPKDTMDSLRRQIRNKLKLLRRRFARPLKFETYFDTATLTTEPSKLDEKLWNKLYDYRSKLAHGSPADFAKEFKTLKNRPTLASFMREVVALLIIEGLRDEAFLTDLKDC